MINSIRLQIINWDSQCIFILYELIFSNVHLAKHVYLFQDLLNFQIYWQQECSKLSESEIGLCL